MSSVDFMQRLLDGVAVEWVALGLVTTIKTGQSVNKQIISANPGDYPVINSGREPLGFINEWNTDNNPIGITTRGAGVGSITWQEGKYFRGNLNYSATINSPDIISTRYLYHLLLEMQSEIQALCTFDGIPALNAGNLKELQIPIPCPENPKKSLEIQAEIVRILDAFTAHTAELTAELTARKKQYNYYRDQLLSFDDREVEWKTLGDLCSIGVGQAPAGNEIGEYAFVNAGTTPSGYVTTYNAEPNTITTPSRGQGGIGYVGYQTTRFWCGPLCYKIRSTSEMLSTRFVYHFMANSMKDIIGLANMAGVPALNKKELVGFPVPIPSIAEQARIVNILDKFDALTNSITEGLPREIELRQKQYEYYRDLLLRFPKQEEEAA
ncbi:restriction endonuclease subunit S [Stutzerimonas kunmingensis]|uniref:restriction endonuclease subunit S n=1 Tax=Stutzerimonas kunmingensis TaxID=1211807 RepID=UPI00241F1EDF|nr:restriction endonuclease subunit S [Stutzerimonas kunmingensis]